MPGLSAYPRSPGPTRTRRRDDAARSAQPGFCPSGLAVVSFDMLGTMTTEQSWPWPETMDALLAAPASHRVLLDNDRVRVLEVLIEPRTREPEHTHRAASVMIVDEPARIRYYVGREMQFESPEHSVAPLAVRVSWMEPEGPHSVENIDERRYHAIRIELK
jgi:hypothetical protein